MENSDHYKSCNWTDLLEDVSFRAWREDPHGVVAEEWKELLQRYPHLQSEADRAIAFLNAVATDRISDHGDRQRQQSAYAALLAAHKQRALTATPPLRPRRPWLKWSAAAAILLLLGVAGWLFLGQSSGSEQIVFATSFGEQQQITLPDGTIVQLNAGSELRYSDDWETAGRRSVWLEGEAYFSVAKGPTLRQRKFVVHTNDLDVNVLGTRFNVNTLSRQGTEVVLDEGSIKLAVERSTNTHDTLTVVPGERIVYDRERNQLERDRVEEESAATSWKEGRLVFDDMTLEEVGYRLQQIFGRQPRFGDPEVAQRKIYLTTSATDLSEFKELLEAMTDNELRVTISPEEILIRRR